MTRPSLKNQGRCTKEALIKAGKVRQAGKREENVQGRNELRGEIPGIRTPASSKGAKALCGSE